ncbi:hypothetical protein, variant [Aphanomyces astaci]|uniref:ABC transmembrane type-1 domain-containing protein n=1 Tax=Aphanomyces astaci TaxID=112090 RepID=W4HC16_APHAT|nr:hypothetical protein, variant [Aphanomyces astaci]ETV88653.1 hypothetical protein, variant [Aphanomyces astaci]|eukprot:XP_009821053.1 hypothetical protein, variant [Aphanomyces astaci]
MAREKESHAATSSAATEPQEKSIRLRFLQFLDSRPWHYFLTTLLLLDFLGNCIVTSVTSTETFYKAAPTTRFMSSACAAMYLTDALGRLMSLRRSYFRNTATIFDGLAVVLLFLALAGRFVWADDVTEVVLTQGAWTNKYELFHEVNTNQKEQYIAATYCLFVAARICLKPRARTFSKKLHKYANHDQLQINLLSLRAAIHRIPGISAASVDMMETDLALICGRQDGCMVREELMQFLQKAMQYRPKELSVDAFLTHLRHVDATCTMQSTYGAFEVIKSTFRHWTTQQVDLWLTVLVVVLYACIVPAMAYCLQILTDQAFPWYMTLSPDFPYWDYSGQNIINVTKTITYKDEMANEDGKNPKENNLNIFKPLQSLQFGIMGILALAVPFVVCDYAMGYFQAKMIAKATQRMQDKLLSVILNQPIQFFNQRTDGDLNNLFQSDIARVNAMWQAVFWNLMQPIVTIAIGFGFLVYIQPVLGIMAFSFAAIVVSSGPQGLAASKSEEFGKKNAFVSAEYQNAIACQKVVRAYAIQSPLLAKFGASIQSLGVAQFGKDFWSGIVQIYIESAMFIFVAVMTACLSIKVYNGDITPGEFFASVTLISRVSTPVSVLGGFMRVAIGNASSLQRLDEVLLMDEIPKGSDHTAHPSPKLPPMQKNIALHHVHFHYSADRPPILHDVDVVFKKGEYSCIVGPSGCGKSTLLGCLMQLHPVSAGQSVGGRRGRQAIFEAKCARPTGGRVSARRDSEREHLGQHPVWPAHGLRRRLQTRGRVGGMPRFYPAAQGRVRHGRGAACAGEFEWRAAAADLLGARVGP